MGGAPIHDDIIIFSRQVWTVTLENMQSISDDIKTLSSSGNGPLVPITIIPYCEKFAENRPYDLASLNSRRKTLIFVNNTLILFQEIIIVPLDEVVSKNNNSLLHLICIVEAGFYNYLLWKWEGGLFVWYAVFYWVCGHKSYFKVF